MAESEPLRAAAVVNDALWDWELHSVLCPHGCGNAADHALAALAATAPDSPVVLMPDGTLAKLDKVGTRHINEVDDNGWHYSRPFTAYRLVPITEEQDRG